MNILYASLILNAVALVIIKHQYNHIKRLQVLVQPMEPIDFGPGNLWYDCDYADIIEEMSE